jgi:cell wall-associated NlpC family hydrolase
MDEAETRAAIVAEALSWEGTGYHDRARVKGVGVDCAQLPIAVFSSLGLIPEIDPDYSPQWYIHRDEELFLSFVTPYAREIGRDEAGPGDFAIWKYGRTYSHGAIIIDPPVIIHATLIAECVTRGDMDREEALLRRPVKFFTLF